MTLPLNTAHLLDWQDLLAGIPDKSVALCLTDMPYGTTQCTWDALIDLAQWWGHLDRVLAPKGAVVCTASQPFTTTLIASNMAWFRHELIWQKNAATGFLNAQKAPLKAHENIIVFGRKGVNYYPEMTKGKCSFVKSGDRRRAEFIYTQRNKLDYASDKRYPKSVLTYDVERHSSKSQGASITLHPTQKPVALFRYLIRLYSQAGDLVIDPFVGSGTTAVAAKYEGRNFIVGDISQEYLGITQKRLNPEIGVTHYRDVPQADISDLPLFRDLE